MEAKLKSMEQRYMGVMQALQGCSERSDFLLVTQTLLLVPCSIN